MVRMQPNAVLFALSNFIVRSSMKGNTGYITHYSPKDMSQNLALVCHLRKFSPPNLSEFRYNISLPQNKTEIRERPSIFLRGFRNLHENFSFREGGGKILMKNSFGEGGFTPPIFGLRAILLIGALFWFSQPAPLPPSRRTALLPLPPSSCPSFPLTSSPTRSLPNPTSLRSTDPATTTLENAGQEEAVTSSRELFVTLKLATFLCSNPWRNFSHRHPSEITCSSRVGSCQDDVRDDQDDLQTDSDDGDYHMRRAAMTLLMTRVRTAVTTWMVRTVLVVKILTTIDCRE
nr:uncharacterized protein LOC117849251 [Setaria viridis]